MRLKIKGGGARTTTAATIIIKPWEINFFAFNLCSLNRKKVNNFEQAVFFFAISFCKHKSFHKRIICNYVLYIKDDKNNGECYFSVRFQK